MSKIDKQIRKVVSELSFSTHHVSGYEIRKVTEKLLHTQNYTQAILKKGRRKGANVEGLHDVLIFDLDTMTKKEVMAFSKQCKYAHIILPSPSQKTAKKDGVWKSRAIVKVTGMSLKQDEYRQQYFGIMLAIGLDTKNYNADRATNDPSRFFYPPVMEEITEAPSGKPKPRNQSLKYAKKHTIIAVNDGRAFDASQIKLKVKSRALKTEKNNSDVSTKKIKEKLKNLNPDMEYSRWLNVAMALFSWNSGKKGFKLFDKWSQRSEKYDGSTHDKWADFESNFNHEISVGTLLAMNKDGSIDEKVEPTSLFKKEKGDRSVIPKKKKKKDSSDKESDRKDEITKFEVTALGAGVTLADVENAKPTRMLYGGVIAEAQHMLFYANGGAMKTTLASWMVADILKRHPEKSCMMFQFDAENEQINGIVEYVYKTAGVGKQFVLHKDLNKDDFQEYFEELVENGIDLKELILVIDTYKFISDNVNDKNANKKAMHFLKSITRLGATIITIAHTNKDGAEVSGTAEMLQDSDAMFVVRADNADVEKDGRSFKQFKITISPAGRSRFSSREVGFVTDAEVSLKKDEDGHIQSDNRLFMRSALENMSVMDEIDLKIAKQDIEHEEEQKLIDGKNAKLRIQYAADLEKIKEALRFFETDSTLYPRQQAIVGRLVDRENPETYIGSKDTATKRLKLFVGHGIGEYETRAANGAKMLIYYIDKDAEQAKMLNRCLDRLRKQIDRENKKRRKAKEALIEEGLNAIDKGVKKLNKKKASLKGSLYKGS